MTEHMAGLKRVLRYVRGTVNMGLIMTKSKLMHPGWVTQIVIMQGT